MKLRVGAVLFVLWAVLLYLALRWNASVAPPAFDCPPPARVTVVHGPKGPLTCTEREDGRGFVLECRPENSPPCR